MKKRPKIKCEIEECTISDPKLLHRHHLIERTEVGTSNDDMNLVILCSNHHLLTHSGKLKIIGVFPGTRPPSGKIVVYELNGKCNIPGINEAYFKYKPPQIKLPNKGQL